MTIAAGFKCKDSIIVCADREIKRSPGKTFETKTWHRQYNDLAVVVTGAGSFPHLESAATKITQRLKGIADIDKAEKVVREVFKYVIKEEFFQKQGCPPSGVPFDLIAGVSTKTHVDIIRFEQGVLRRGKDKELAGLGAHIASYFFDQYYDQYYHPPVPLSDGMTLGAFIIYAVKNSGLGCGGPTDLWVLEKGANAAHYNVRYLDSIFQSLRIPFRDILYATAHLGLTEDEFDIELDRICRLTKQFRISSLPNWKRARRALGGLPR
jgi:20S proteasome alpha/beta subunit